MPSERILIRRFPHNPVSWSCRPRGRDRRPGHQRPYPDGPASDSPSPFRSGRYINEHPGGSQGPFVPNTHNNPTTDFLRYRPTGLGPPVQTKRLRSRCRTGSERPPSGICSWSARLRTLGPHVIRHSVPHDGSACPRWSPRLWRTSRIQSFPALPARSPPQPPLPPGPILRPRRHPNWPGLRWRLAAGNGSGSRGDQLLHAWPPVRSSLRRPNRLLGSTFLSATPSRPTGPGHERGVALANSRIQWLQTACSARSFRVKTSRWVVNRGCDGASGFSVVRDPRFTWTRRP